MLTESCVMFFSPSRAVLSAILRDEYLTSAVRTKEGDKAGSNQSNQGEKIPPPFPSGFHTKQVSHPPTDRSGSRPGLSALCSLPHRVQRSFV